MDYEKAYKDAKARMSRAYNSNRCTIGFMNEIFPELKEPDDERIRKALIEMVHDTTGDELWVDYNVHKEETLTWLEKQVEKPQGKTALEAINEVKVDNQNCVKTNDKVEPKFKVGDWIVNSIETVQITGYDIDYGYQVDYKGNLQHRDTDIIEKEYHLWTIQYAQDGDVLYSLCCGELWIFEDEKKCHVGYNPNYNSGYIVINKPIHIPADVQPATKEQRDLLFQKMKESGYEWDEEKKELKRLEKQVPKQKWSEEDEKMLNHIIGLLEGLPNLHNWLKSLKEKMGG